MLAVLSYRILWQMLCVGTGKPHRIFRIPALHRLCPGISQPVKDRICGN